jgi:hypothetical protein
LNLQHNCFDGECQVKKNKRTEVERQDTSICLNQVCHTNDVDFILNSASFHAPDEHRRIAHLTIMPIQPDELVEGMDQGHEIWNENRED